MTPGMDLELGDSESEALQNSRNGETTVGAERASESPGNATLEWKFQVLRSRLANDSFKKLFG